LLPQDDLTLACVLKSPLIGLDDDDLLELAPRRPASLCDALRASPDPKHVMVVKKLARWRERANGGPFAFYASLLGADGGRRDLEARLGPEAADALDEFLSLAMAYEGGAAPSLAGFLNDMNGIEYSIKRDMETGADAVRVMTVHAAKGLEAKIVFLPDSCGVPSARHDPKIFKLGTTVPGDETIAWSPRKELDCKPVTAAREAARDEAEEEYRRLLYVALTRAEERLYLAGFHGPREPDPGSWAKMIEAALAHQAEIEIVPAFWGGEDNIRRLISKRSGVPGAAMIEDQIAAPPVALPDWLSRAARFEASAKPPVRPSRALLEHGRPGGVEPAQARRAASRRGRLIHLLLQYLPDVAAQHRRGAALALLSARAADLDDVARQNLAEQALKVIGLPELGCLFGPGSKAEVVIAGKIVSGQRTIEVAGQVDRIGEDGKDVWVADYKTGPPCALDGTPATYLAQLAFYRAVLAPLWPNKNLRMLLIWTEGPAVVPFPGETLDAALAAFAGEG
jgi:ATP-dependent helicase/nuclease subunit A